MGFLPCWVSYFSDLDCQRGNVFFWKYGTFQELLFEVFLKPSYIFAREIDLQRSLFMNGMNLPQGPHDVRNSQSIISAVG
jgi:hypothetical protein